MIRTVDAVFHDGAFHPKEPVELPDNAEVRIQFESPEEDLGDEAEMYRIMGLRFESGDPFGSERHNERQP